MESLALGKSIALTFCARLQQATGDFRLPDAFSQGTLNILNSVPSLHHFETPTN